MFSQPIIGTSHLNAARFPREAELRLREACIKLGVQKTELIVAGTLAEIDRRMTNLQSSAEQPEAPTLPN